METPWSGVCTARDGLRLSGLTKRDPLPFPSLRTSMGPSRSITIQHKLAGLFFALIAAIVVILTVIFAGGIDRNRGGRARGARRRVWTGARPRGRGRGRLRGRRGGARARRGDRHRPEHRGGDDLREPRRAPRLLRDRLSGAARRGDARARGARGSLRHVGHGEGREARRARRADVEQEHGIGPAPDARAHAPHERRGAHRRSRRFVADRRLGRPSVFAGSRRRRRR